MVVDFPKVLDSLERGMMTLPRISISEKSKSCFYRAPSALDRANFGRLAQPNCEYGGALFMFDFKARA
jgi:hypothetical protein